MTTLIRVAVAVAAALLGLGGFVAVQAATGSDQPTSRSGSDQQSSQPDPSDQAAKREDSLSVLTTADDEPTPDDDPSPADTRAGRDDAPELQDDSSTGVGDDSQTRTRTRGDDDRVDTSGHDGSDDVRDAADTSGHDDTSDDRHDGADTSGHGGDDDSSGRG
jgi:hypothetical protein